MSYAIQVIIVPTAVFMLRYMSNIEIDSLPRQSALSVYNLILFLQRIASDVNEKEIVLMRKIVASIISNQTAMVD